MGCFAIYCILCALPSAQEDIIFKWYEEPDNNSDKENKVYMKYCKWLIPCVFLTRSNHVIKGIVNDSCADNFTDSKRNIYDYDDLTDKTRNGVFVHFACYDYVKKKTGITLKFDMLPVEKDFLKLVNDKTCGIKIKTDAYRITEKYRGQYLDLSTLSEKEKIKAICAPTVKGSYAERTINKVIGMLKLKKDRAGPNISASFASDKSYRMGNDGYFWQKIGGKWKKINVKPVVEHGAITKSISQLGEESKKPIFLEKTDKDILIYTLPKNGGNSRVMSRGKSRNRSRVRKLTKRKSLR